MQDKRCQKMSYSLHAGKFAGLCFVVFFSFFPPPPQKKLTFKKIVQEYQLSVK